MKAHVTKMESVPLQKIREKAEAYDSLLRADDGRFRRSATLNHTDGSRLYFNSAFLMLMDSEWVACFTEHHGVFIYHITDLSSYWESEKRGQTIEVFP